MHKGLSIVRMKKWLGYECRTGLREGLRQTIKWYLANPDARRL